MPELSSGPLQHIQHWKELQPESIALHGPNLTLTWQSLAQYVGETATFIAASGIQAGDRILVSGNSETQQLLTLAVLEAGAVPANFSSDLDPTSLIAMGFSKVISPVLITVPAELSLLVLPPTIGGASMKNGKLSRSFAPESMIRVVFSSGTTGQPKGIPFTFAVLMGRVKSGSENYMKESPYLTTVDFSTVSGNTSLFLDLWRGVTHFVPGSPQQNLNVIEKYGIKGLMGSPSTLGALLSAKSKSSSKVTVDTIYSAGSFLSPNIASQLSSSFQAKVVNIYGSTEAGLVGFSDGVSTENALQLFDGVRVKITSDQGSRSPDGVVGVLHIQTPYMAHEYLGQPALSESSFQDKFFVPGDLALLDGEKLRLLGRSDDLLNLDGEKIDPLPIERHVVANFEVTDAACTLTKGNAGKAELVLLVVCPEDLDLDGLKRNLYSVFRIHSPASIIRVGSLPRNMMGKILRHSLGNLFQSRSN